MSRKKIARGRRTTRLGALAAVSLSMLAGAFTVSAGASVKAHAVTPVIIGNQTGSITSAPMWVGNANGIFAKHGLQMSNPTLSASTIVAALVSGSVNAVQISATSFLQSRMQGVPVEAISAYDEGVNVGLVLSTTFATQMGITASTPLKTVMTDLIGSTGGSSSVSTTGFAATLFRYYGINTSQYKVATFSSLPAVIAGVQKGSVNWFVAAEPNGFQAEAAGYGLLVASSANAPAWQTRQLNQLIVATTAFASSHPALMKKMVRGVEAAVAYIRLHAQQSVSIVQANLPGVTRPIILKSLHTVQWPLTGQMNANIWRSTIAFVFKEGQIPRGITVKEGTDWTNAYT